LSQDVQSDDASFVQETLYSRDRFHSTGTEVYTPRRLETMDDARAVSVSDASTHASPAKVLVDPLAKKEMVWMAPSTLPPVPPQMVPLVASPEEAARMLLSAVSAYQRDQRLDTVAITTSSSAFRSAGSDGSSTSDEQLTVAKSSPPPPPPLPTSLHLTTLRHYASLLVSSEEVLSIETIDSVQEAVCGVSVWPDDTIPLVMQLLSHVYRDGMRFLFPLICVCSHLTRNL